jgi:hypothetical protein
MKNNKNNLYKKVSIEDELPPLNKYVTVFFENEEFMVFKRVEDVIINPDNLLTWSWKSRDAVTINTPTIDKIVYWLKEVNSSIEQIEDIHLTDFNSSIDTDYLIRYSINDISIYIPRSKLKEIILNYLTK